MTQHQGGRRVPRRHLTKSAEKSTSAPAGTCASHGSGAHDNATTKAGAETGFDELGLSDAVLAAVADMGHTTPTPVQAQAIPLALAGGDVLAAAQTGTGKTAAFLLPSLDRLGHARGGQGPLMLVITPTRELAQQIDDVAQTIARHTHHRVTTVVGGVDYEPQKDALRRGCDVLVATPGRLQDLIDQGCCNLSQVEVLVLDEADRMLDMGFLPAVKKIVAKTPQSRQTLLFSATLDDDAMRSTAGLVRKPSRVEIARKGTVAETIEQFALPVSLEAKNALLVDLRRQEGSARVIVFCKGKHRADGICRRLRRAKISCAPIHGNRSQRQRENALRNFREGEVDVLVATDVLARGIDVPEVSYVVNFDVPADAEDYIHRIGRTGRAGESGWAITFVTEDDYLSLRDAEQLMKAVVPPFPRAGSLELGERPPVLDPDRDPMERLPGKKARKKMAEERAATREAGSPSTSLGSQGGRKPRDGRGRSAKAEKAPAPEARAGEKSASHRGSRDVREKKAADGRSRRRGRRGERTGEGSRRQAQQAEAGRNRAQRDGGRGRSRSGRDASRGREASSRQETNPFGPTKPKAKPQRLKRHPGDRGGRR